MAVPSSVYSLGDRAEDAVNRMLNSAWNRPLTKLNRKTERGINLPQTIDFPDGETYVLPDITVFFNKEDKTIEMRVEVKSFQRLPTIESPDQRLPLFPIKRKQLNSYWDLFQKDEITLRLVIVVGRKEYPDEYVYYWANIDDIAKMKKIYSMWDDAPSFWFNIEDMHSDFSNF